MSQIVVDNLVKTYKISKKEAGLLGAFKSLIKREYVSICALDHISFQIQPGQLVGYIGPNGAGKSTTIKIMSGILVPDSGRCEILGRVPWLERIEHVGCIGVVFGQRTQLWWDLPVIDSFHLLKDIYRIKPHDYTRMKDELTTRLNLENLLHIPVRQLSLGQRMRCELAASLLHKPRLLFLDEPTIGLDAVSKLAVRDFISELNKQHGTTVILTTHDMDDIEALCSRIMVIGKGKVLFDGSLTDLRKKVLPERRIIVDFADHAVSVDLPHVTIVERDEGRVVFSFNPEQYATTDVIAKILQQAAVKDIIVENPPIERIIAELYGKFEL